jgi:hypothetical protein
LLHCALVLVLGTTQIAQFDKLKGTIEEYADREAEEVKSRYVAKLALEREATLRLKGENGIMKKKFSTLNKQASHTCREYSCTTVCKAFSMYCAVAVYCGYSLATLTRLCTCYCNTVHTEYCRSMTSVRTLKLYKRGSMAYMTPLRYTDDAHCCIT